jgi:hypothetical protein
VGVIVPAIFLLADSFHLKKYFHENSVDPNAWVVSKTMPLAGE